MSADSLQETRLKVPFIPPAFNGLKAAKRYAKFGWYVGPVRVGTKNPGSVLGGGWHEQTTRDPDEIDDLWRRRDYGVFLHAGRSGAAIFDVDHPERLPEALRTAIEECHPPYQSTRPDEIGRGHYLFQIPDGRDFGNSTGKLGNGWGEVRARNGVIIVAPSIHPDGGRYKWLARGELPVLPDYVAELLLDSPQSARNATRAQVKKFLATYSDPEPGGQEPDSLHKHLNAFRKAVKNGASRHESMKGHLVGAMKEAKAGVLVGELAEDELKRAYFEAVVDVPGTSRHARSAHEAEVEWNDMLRWAVGQAIEADPEVTRERIRQQFSGVVPEHVRELPSDRRNALQLIDAHEHRFRHVVDMKRWYCWDGVRWAYDHGDVNIRAAHVLLAERLPEGGNEQRSFKRNSLSASGISSAVRVAEIDQRTSIMADALDAHPELLNTPSGVIDLRTGELMDSDPALLLTKATAYPADINAPHPRWSKFLEETFPGSPELIGYLQRLAGLALLGSVREHILPFLHGTGANGKGVITLVLQGLLGDAEKGGYAATAPDGFLMSGREGAHPTEIARLRGARLVVCSEQSSGKKFDETKVKRLTGGDILTGRFMNRDFFDFTPSHLVWVMSNHLPAVREGGQSFWRRVRRIPFMHVVPQDQQVKDLHDQLLRDEGAAIFGWAVRGAVEVLKNGLQDPPEVVKATHEYETSEDSLVSFIETECVLEQGAVCKISELRTRYERHCDLRGRHQQYDTNLAYLTPPQIGASVRRTTLRGRHQRRDV
jgi:P4 family phage/plasmid primase-like protien